MTTAAAPPRVLSPDEEDRAIAHALSILESRLRSGPLLSRPEDVKTYLRLQSQGLAHEVFAIMYLDAQSRLIAYERLFRGTLSHAVVHPREVVKQALARNAASVILHHNHPSDSCIPSANDLLLTETLTSLLRLVDVRVIDHVITTDSAEFSMAEHGRLA